MCLYHFTPTLTESCGVSTFGWTYPDETAYDYLWRLEEVVCFCCLIAPEGCQAGSHTASQAQIPGYKDFFLFFPPQTMA